MDATLNSDKIYLSDNIRFLRKQMDLSQEELAVKLGLNRGNIASYEKGTAKPKLCNLLRFAEFFGVSLLDLTQRHLQNFSSVPVPERKKSISPEEQGMIDEYSQRAAQIGEVLDSLNCYHCFKTGSIADMPKDMQMLVMNFEKLFEVAQVLRDSHEELLAFLQSKCPQSFK